MYFWYHGPLPPDSKLFRGRQLELIKIKELCQGELRSYLIIFSGRQTGKTSLYYRAATLLSDQHLVCRIDLQSLTGAYPEQVYGFIGERLANVIGELHSFPNRGELNSVELSRLLLDKLDKIRHDKLVLLFEELGSLPQATGRSLANLLRSWFNERFEPGRQSLGKVMIVLAGGIELYNLAAIEVSPLSNISEKIYLPDLSEKEAIALVADGLNSSKVPPELSMAYGKVIYKLVSGHPYLTQRIGGEIQLLSENANVPMEDIEEISYSILIRDDPLIQHLNHSLDKLQLWQAVPILMSGQVKHSRHDEEMALLELLGLASEEDGFWVVRNKLFERMLSVWSEAKNSRNQQVVSKKYLVSLANLIDQTFSREELRGLCFQLFIDFDNLPPEGKNNQARELILVLNRRGRLSELIKILVEIRPNVTWANL